MNDGEKVRVSLPSPWQAWHCASCESGFATLIQEPEYCPYCGEMDSCEIAEITLTGTPDDLEAFKSQER